MKRKHYNEIIAYAEGNDIEYSCDGLVWKDCQGFPMFLDDHYYRIKYTPLVVPWDDLLPKFKYAVKAACGAVYISEHRFQLLGGNRL